MFWGLIMEPNKRYTQVVEKPFHISQAAIDISTGDNDPCQVMIVVDGKNFLVCTLQKNKMLQTPLDLYFKAGDSISFLGNGSCNVHLTGYLDPEFEEEESDDDDDEDEAPALVQPSKNKRKVENNHDATPSKKAKTGKAVKQLAADSSDDEDDDNQLQKLLDGEIDSDENDESFKINTSADSDDEEDDDEEEEDEDDDEEEEAEAEEEDEEEEEESAPDTSKEELDLSKLSKNQRRKLKLKQKKEMLKQQPQLNGIEKPQDKKQDKKEKKKEMKKEESSAEKKEKKSLSGGVQIEDMKVGNGPAAKPGKTVMVYYEGRLKQNNKKFDDCVKGPGFKFRLGAKEVISGWDVGIAGMKAGGKRRIVCPPAMAYGAKGSPPVIPPNSTLVFEVELKEVK